MQSGKYCLILILFCFQALAGFVDIKVYVPKSLKVDKQALQNEMKNAERIFAAAGVTLRVLSIDSVEMAVQDLSFLGHYPQYKSDDRAKGFYQKLDQEKHVLSAKAIQVFSKVIGKQPNSDRTIHVILLQELKSMYNEKGKQVVVNTGAQSFPPYLLNNRIPRALRGVITLQELPGRNLAHELGHKLMNVSHEWRDIAPQMEIQAEGGLMLYGRGEEIPQGTRGRYHQERLHLSPFLYRLEKGKKIWNADFQNGGAYNDPLYGSSVVVESI